MTKRQWPLANHVGACNKHKTLAARCNNIYWEETRPGARNCGAAAIPHATKVWEELGLGC